MPFNRNRRPMEWFNTSRSFTSLAASTQVSTTLFSAAAQGTRSVLGATVTRELLDIYVQAESVAQLVEMYYGLAILSQDAVLASGLPDPDSETDRADWLTRGRIMTIQASLSDSSQWGRVHLDLRSQRILRSEEDQVELIFNNTTAFILKWAFDMRMLIKLP